MRKKLEGNGLWESSRMMLPEHKAAIQSHTETNSRRTRISLDEQEWEAVTHVMTQSLQTRAPISVRLFHPIETLQVIGIVDRLDEQQKRFMVDGEWFRVADIERAQLAK